VRSPRTKMLRALKTLQRQNDTRRLRPMSMNRATDNDAVSGHSEALLGWAGNATKRIRNMRLGQALEGKGAEMVARFVEGNGKT